MSFPAPGRHLPGADLADYVGQLADRSDLWRHLVDHDPNRRRYEELMRDEHVAAWLICWMEDQDTGFHDHDISAGAVAVISGQVREERFRLARTPAQRTFSAGERFHFGASDIHRVRHAGAHPAITLHVYSPPLVRMGAYLVEPDGTLTRHTISYQDELRPLEPSAR